MPAEDERKLQTKLFVKLRVWRSKDRNHRFMMVDFKNHAVSTEKSGLFCFITYKEPPAWVALFAYTLVNRRQAPASSWRVLQQTMGHRAAKI